MLITKTQLKQIIKEELSAVLDEPALPQATTATDAYGAEEMTSAEYLQAIEDRGTVVQDPGTVVSADPFSGRTKVINKGKWSTGLAPYLTDADQPATAYPADVPERGWDPKKIPSTQKAPLASVKGILDAQQYQRLSKFKEIDQKIEDWYNNCKIWSLHSEVQDQLIQEHE